MRTRLDLCVPSVQYLRVYCVVRVSGGTVLCVIVYWVVSGCTVWRFGVYCVAFQGVLHSPSPTSVVYDGDGLSAGRGLSLIHI